MALVTRSLMRAARLRVVRVGWVFHLKTLTRSGFFVLTAVIQPVIFATIAFYMFAGAADGRARCSTSRSAPACMGIWSSTLFGSGGAIQRQRWQGTLEFARRRADTVRARARCRSTLATRDDRALLARRHARLGTPALRRPARARAPVPVRARAAGSRARARPARARARRDVRSSTGTPTRSRTCSSTRSGLSAGLLVPISLLPGVGRSRSPGVLAPTWGVKAVRESGARRRRRWARSACASALAASSTWRSVSSSSATSSGSPGSERRSALS